MRVKSYIRASRHKRWGCPVRLRGPGTQASVEEGGIEPQLRGFPADVKMTQAKPAAVSRRDESSRADLLLCVREKVYVGRSWNRAADGPGRQQYRR